MIPVDQALEHLFALVKPLQPELVPLRRAAGRVLIQDVTAARTQPPFAASSMDGYALRRAEVEPDAMFKVVGEAAAGHRFEGSVKAGQAVRIFTGAPVPEDTDFVVIQEDVTRKGDLITLGHAIGTKDNIRPAGGDFTAGQKMTAPKRLRPADIALLAAMNIAQVPVTRKPSVAILATGDELVQPGERASVGDHDLVAPVAAQIGMEQSFYKVAMRPGKPLMAGRLGDAAMIGLPGNPVSALVCGQVFVVPMVRKMLGLGAAAAPRRMLPLGVALPANGPRDHYMRAMIRDGMVYPDTRQDSSLLSVLAAADVLMVRPAHQAEVEIGTEMACIDL